MHFYFIAQSSASITLAGDAEALWATYTWTVEKIVIQPKRRVLMEKTLNVQDQRTHEKTKTYHFVPVLVGNRRAGAGLWSRGRGTGHAIVVQSTQPGVGMDGIIWPGVRRQLVLGILCAGTAHRVEHHASYSAGGIPVSQAAKPSLAGPHGAEY